jgi:2,3-bisphosphoglycerate-dependent phosphoglycerate mutase
MSDIKLATIYIVRHGESESNAHIDKDSSFHTQWGEFESPLTQKGEEQAQKRAEALRSIEFDAVFSSDLTRAKQTAEIIKLERKLAVQTTRVIRERSYGNYLKSFKDKSREQIESEMKKELTMLDEMAKMTYKPSPDVESPAESASRLITFLREVAVAYAGKKVLVVNHGNNMRNLLTHLGYAKFDELATGDIENTGYIVLESDGTDFFIKETHGVHKQTGKVRTF